MAAVILVLRILALLALAAAAAGVNSHKWNLTAVGLFLWLASEVLR